MRNEMDRRRVPDLLLEQYRLDELRAEDGERVRHALAADPSVAERLVAIERSDREIADSYPAGRLAEQVRRRAFHNNVEVAPRYRRWALPLAAAATIGALAFAVPAVVPGIRDRAADNPDTAAGDRLKGAGPSLAVYRRTDRGSETLADGAVIKPGDVVRLGYSPAGRTYGVIVSVDTRGTVTQHLPPDGGRSVKLGRERMNLLATAYELDDVPGWERFYFVTSDAAFDVAPVVDLIRRAATAPRGRPTPLPLPGAFDQFMFLLQKEVRP